MADYTFVYDAVDSDLSVSGALFNKRVTDTAQGAGNVDTVIPFNNTDSGYFFTEPGELSSLNWRAGDSIAGRVRVLIAPSAGIVATLRIKYARVNAAGVFQQDYSNFTPTQNLSVPAPYSLTFTATSLVQTGVQGSDRLRIEHEFTSDDALAGSRDVRHRTGFDGTGTTSIPIPVIEIHASGLRDAVIVSQLVGSMIVESIVDSPSTFKVLPYTARHSVDSSGNASRPEGNSFFLHPTHGDRVTRVGTPYYQTAIYQKVNGVNSRRTEKWLLDSSSAITGLNLSDVVVLPEKF